MDARTAPTVTGRRVTQAFRGAAVAGVVAATVVVASGAFGPTRQSAAAAELRPFGDCAAVASWYGEALTPLMGPWGLQTWGGGRETMTLAVGEGAGRSAQAAEGAEVATDAQAPDAVGNGETGTNVQESGVDEPDIMKLWDGRLVTTVDDRLVVYDVTGAEPLLLGDVVVPGLAQYQWTDGWETSDGPEQAGTAELLVAGDRAVLFAQQYAMPLSSADDTADRSMVPHGGGTPTTVSTVVDLADPSAPRVVSSTEVEGSLVSARLSDGAVRVVTTSTPSLDLPVIEQPPTGPDTVSGLGWDEGYAAWEKEATQQNLAVLAATPGEAFLPHRVQRDGDGDITSRVPAMECSDLAHPAESSGGGVLSVQTLDVQAAADSGNPVVDVVGVSTDGDLVYASADRLYVATTSGGWTRRGGPAIDMLPVEPLEPLEPLEPVEPVEPVEVSTDLHGFDISDPARASYLASGQVDGWLLGRWALSAREGMLRVATTRGDIFGGPGEGQAPRTDSAVTVLAERDGALLQVGVVEGLGQGEQIRAVRWFDDVAMVVTFRQTDPLYVVDLSDPAAPTVRGELKVPGYSAYLHPLGDGQLLGIGQDASDTGQTTGLQVSTFDVSDPGAPTRLNVLTQNDVWSSVEHDPRQFSYLPERRIALIPSDGLQGSSVQAFSIGADGALSVAGVFSAGDPQRGGWLQRVMPVGAGAVAALSSDQDGPVLSLLRLDDLSVTGTAALGR